LLLHSSEIKGSIAPTDDFMHLLKQIHKVRAGQETNLAKTIDEAIMLFPSTDVTKHLILLTDAVPTVGETPEHDVLEKVMEAKNAGITISLIGINLDEKGKLLAQKIVELGEGRLHVVKDIEKLDMLVLEDYYSL
jgi:Mg-chelatase subunit ChlD